MPEGEGAAIAAVVAGLTALLPQECSREYPAPGWNGECMWADNTGLPHPACAIGLGACQSPLTLEGLRRESEQAPHRTRRHDMVRRHCRAIRGRSAGRNANAAREAGARTAGARTATALDSGLCAVGRRLPATPARTPASPAMTPRRRASRTRSTGRRRIPARPPRRSAAKAAMAPGRRTSTTTPRAISRSSRS